MGKIGDLILFNVFENKKIYNLKSNRISILYHNVIYSKKLQSIKFKKKI